MNKNLFKTFAIAAMAVLAGACAKEQVGPSDGETTEVSFNVEVPGASVATKGISDAASVDELVFQALLQHKYTDPETKKTVKEYIPVPELTKVVPVVDKKASITASLVKGQWYQFIFWAQKKGTGYYNVNTDELSNIDLRTITLDYKKVKTNDEFLDAFYAVQGPKQGAVFSSDVKLTRALAQINFGSEQSKRQDAKISKASITLKNVPTTFYPLSAGTLSACGNISEQDIVLSANDVMSEPLSVNSVNYDYLATTYVFAPKKDQILVDASATFNFESGRTIAVKAPNAPVKQNFRTNIVGNLLLANAEWNVIINPDFQSGDIAYDAVSSCLQAGQTVTLTEDYFVADKSKGVTLDVGVTSVLNLNGKKFSNENGLGDNKAALQVHGDLTINGDGEVYCEGGADNNAIIVEQGGHLVINGGTYNVGANTNSGKSNATIFVMGPDKYGRNGSVEINGGVFMAKAGSGSDATPATPFVLNQQDDITVNCFSVKGGTFVGFNPANVNENKGAITSFVAEGYRSVKTEYEGKEAWKVEEIPAVTTHEDFNSAITSASAGVSATIKLASNMTAVLDNGIANADGDSEAEQAKRRNLTFIGDGTQTMDVVTGAITAEGGQLSYQRGSSFTFKNLKIKAGEGNFDGVVCDELVFENCTITGKLTLFGKASFKDCVFENTMANQYSIWTWGGTDVTFDKCTFNTNGKAILLYGGADGKNPTNLVVKNCILNDRNNGSAGKAAIEIGNDYNATYSLTITNCTVNGFAEGKNTGSKLWANKNNMDTAHLSVTIDGTKVQ